VKRRLQHRLHVVDIINQPAASDKDRQLSLTLFIAGMPVNNSRPVCLFPPDSLFTGLVKAEPVFLLSLVSTPTGVPTMELDDERSPFLPVFQHHSCTAHGTIALHLFCRVTNY